MPFLTILLFLTISLKPPSQTILPVKTTKADKADTKRWEDDHSLNDLDAAYSNALLAYVRDSVAGYMSSTPKTGHDVTGSDSGGDSASASAGASASGSASASGGNSASARATQNEHTSSVDSQTDKLQFETSIDTAKVEEETEETLARILLAGTCGQLTSLLTSLTTIHPINTYNTFH